MQEKIILILILVFGFVLFNYRLNNIPNGFYSDEATIGYNAYSILQTGRDEYGQFFPIFFKLFGSYTPGLFVYLQTIPIKIFGLNIYAIRFLSTIFMIITGLNIYLFLKNNKLLKSKLSLYLSLILFFITPWTIFNARLGYETTFAFALISAGILLYKRPTLSFLLISLSTYTGYSQRYLAPLIILLIIFLFYRGKDIKKSIFITLLSQIPNFILMFTPAFWVKSSSFTSSFFTQYLSYFSPYYLFSRGDYDLQRSLPQISVFYSWMFVSLIIGIYYLYKNFEKPIYKYLLGLLLICPLPAALANTTFSTQRALPMLLPYSIIIFIGLDKIIFKLNNFSKFIIVFLLIGYSSIMLFRSYFILFPKERLVAWDYGYKEVASYISSHPEKHFVVDNSRGVPYINILFFLKYPPKDYQKNANNYYSNTVFTPDSAFANVEIRPIGWKLDICQPQILVGDSLSISSDQIIEHKLSKIFEIKDDNKIILQAYETNPQLKCKI